MKAITIEEISYDRNDKVYMTVRDKERGVEAVKTMMYIFQEFIIFNSVLF